MTATNAANYRLVFGYQHVDGVPPCPCADPGNYLAMEQSTSDPLDVLFRCWCGRTMKGRMDTHEELAALLVKNGQAATPAEGRRRGSATM